MVLFDLWRKSRKRRKKKEEREKKFNVYRGQTLSLAPIAVKILEEIVTESGK
jgi:hypothetical protein